VQFVKDVETYLPHDGRGVAIATAWLNTDNLIVALLARFFPTLWQGVQLVAVDTLHLFPETYSLAEEIQKEYGKAAIITKPLNANTRVEFETLHGKAEDTSAADFEFHSKVEPFQRGLELSAKSISITGRRADQGNQRQVLDVWEDDKKTFNPLADWSWSEITEMVDLFKIPYNKKHNLVYASAEPIPATERHKDDLPWVEHDLGKPYWQAQTDIKLLHHTPATQVYVWKSFGDVHTSVPVLAHESERAGRFVRLNKTECGIHTRATVAKGQPHGGLLVDLMENDPEKRAAAIAKCEGMFSELFLC
jgi:phosphoadenosine phosphosulfate reductase